MTAEYYGKSNLHTAKVRPAAKTARVNRISSQRGSMCAAAITIDGIVFGTMQKGLHLPRILKEGEPPAWEKWCAVERSTATLAFTNKYYSTGTLTSTRSATAANHRRIAEYSIKD